MLKLMNSNRSYQKSEKKDDYQHNMVYLGSMGYSSLVTKICNNVKIDSSDYTIIKDLLEQKYISEQFVNKILLKQTEIEIETETEKLKCFEIWFMLTNSKSQVPSPKRCVMRIAQSVFCPSGGRTF